MTKIAIPDAKRIEFKIEQILRVTEEVKANDYGSKDYEDACKALTRYNEVKHCLTYIYDASWQELIDTFCSEDKVHELIQRSKDCRIIID